MLAALPRVIIEYLKNIMLKHCEIIRGDKMKIIVSLCIGILILAGCGKKSEPKYQGKIQQSKIIL